MHHNLRASEGSAVVGFAFVAPLLVMAFIAIVTISNIVRQETVLSAACAAAVRAASVADGNTSQGMTAAHTVLRDQGEPVNAVRISWGFPVVNGVSEIHVPAQRDVSIPWLRKTFTVSRTARAVDEKSLS